MQTNVLQLLSAHGFMHLGFVHVSKLAPPFGQGLSDMRSMNASDFCHTRLSGMRPCTACSS
jgi:hypothetical protein